MEFLVHNISHSDLIVELSWIRDEPNGVETEHPDCSNNSNSSSNGCDINNNSNSSINGSTRKHHSPRVVVMDDGTSVPLSLLGRPKFSLFQQTSRAIMDKVEELLRAAPANATHLSSACEEDTAGNSSSSSMTATTESAALRSSASTRSSSDSTASLPVSMLGIETQRSNGRGKKARRCETQSPVGFRLDAQPIPVATLHDFQIQGGSETYARIAQHWTRVAITAVYFPLVALLLPKWQRVLREFASERSKQLVYLISGAGVPRNTAHAHQHNSTQTTAQLLALFVRQYYPHVTVVTVHSGSNIFRFDDNVQFMTSELRPRLEAHRELLVDRYRDAWRAHFHVTIAYADGPPARLSALNASLRIYRPSYLHVWQLKTFWHEQRLSLCDVDFHAFENIEAAPSVAVATADALTKTLVKEMRLFRDQFLQGEGDGEVAGFWLRKSRKPVLAVLLVEKRDRQTGETTFVVHRGMNCEVSMPTGSLCAERNAIGSALASDPTLQRRSMKMIGVLSLNLGGTVASVGTNDGASRSNAVAATVSDSSSAVSAMPAVLSVAVGTPPPPPHSAPVAPVPPVAPVSPKRRRLENSNLASPRKPKRPRTFSCDDEAVAVALAADNSDRNPLAPCGACKEWLVKIAEANPSFRVVTFENARCRNVYISHIM